MSRLAFSTASMSMAAGEVGIAADAIAAAFLNVEHLIGTAVAIRRAQEVQVAPVFGRVTQADDDVGAAVFQHGQPGLRLALLWQYRLDARGGFLGARAGRLDIVGGGQRHAHAAARERLRLAEQTDVAAWYAQRIGHAFEGDAGRFVLAVDDGRRTR